MSFIENLKKEYNCEKSKVFAFLLSEEDFLENKEEIFNANKNPLLIDDNHELDLSAKLFKVEKMFLILRRIERLNDENKWWLMSKLSMKLERKITLICTYENIDAIFHGYATYFNNGKIITEAIEKRKRAEEKIAIKKKKPVK